MTYRCKDCEEIFEDWESAYVEQGYDTYIIGDQRVNRYYGEDGCPFCLSVRLEDYTPPEEEENEE